MTFQRTQFIILLLVLFPIIGFLFIYTDNIIYTSIASLLIGYLGVNVYRYFKQLHLLVVPAVYMLMGVFYFYAFYGLGSIQTPQTYRKLSTANDTIVFNFQKEVEIDKICYYVGIDKNVNFQLSSMQGSRWKSFYTYKKNYPFSFKWKCLNADIQTSQIQLHITKNKMMLNEIRFFKEDNIIPYSSVSKVLDDEPHTQIDSSYYSSMFFDEIYFGRTAFEIIKNKAVYENTHPYLGKFLIIPGIKLFGMTPFGWRFMNVLFAGLIIFMMYYLAMQLFRDKYYAFGASFLMTYSFMHLAQGRIALIDTFGIFFVLVSYFYLYRFIIKQELSKLLISGVFFGLAASVKWSSVFASLGFVLIAGYLILSKYPLKNKFRGIKLLGYGLLAYGVVALFIYVLSFWDIYAKTGTLQSIIDYNINMYHYHSTLQATHPYSSVWWQWPLDIVPMGYYRNIQEGLISSINAFGNPAIFWLGIIAIFYLIFTSIKYKKVETIFILFSFLGLYLPYIFVGRLMFIYHFYYAVPFMMLAIIYMFKDTIEKFIFMRYVYIGYLLLVAGLFLAFYPVLSGYAIDKSYVDGWLRWFDTWWF